MKKISNVLRDLLMRRPETLVKDGKLYFYGDVFAFNPVAEEKIDETIEDIKMKLKI